MAQRKRRRSSIAEKAAEQTENESYRPWWLTEKLGDHATVTRGCCALLLDVHAWQNPSADIEPVEPTDFWPGDWGGLGDPWLLIWDMVRDYRTIKHAYDRVGDDFRGYHPNGVALLQQSFVTAHGAVIGLTRSLIAGCALRQNKLEALNVGADPLHRARYDVDVHRLESKSLPCDYPKPIISPVDWPSLRCALFYEAELVARRLESQGKTGEARQARDIIAMREKPRPTTLTRRELAKTGGIAESTLQRLSRNPGTRTCDEWLMLAPPNGRKDRESLRLKIRSAFGRPNSDS